MIRISLCYFNDIQEKNKSLLISHLDNLKLTEQMPQSVSLASESAFFGDHQDELVVFINDQEKELATLNQTIKSSARKLSQEFEHKHKTSLYNIPKSERCEFKPHIGLGRIRLQSIKNHTKDLQQLHTLAQQDNRKHLHTDMLCLHLHYDLVQMLPFQHCCRYQ